MNDVVEVKTKAQKAQDIYTQEVEKGEEKLRARVIKRLKDELGMSDAGGSTYFQNCKTRSKGEKVKHYYKSKSKVNEQKNNEAVDDSKEDMDLFDVELKDGSIKSFMSQQSRDEFVEQNKDLIKE